VILLSTLGTRFPHAPEWLAVSALDLLFRNAG
jgi:hypothetical protein